MKIVPSDKLPDPLKKELDALIAAMKTKYGKHVVMMALHIENLSGLCALITRAADMTNKNREEAYDAARGICLTVLRDLGEAWNVDPDSAFAVAESLQDYKRMTEAELLGTNATVPQDVQDAAAEAITLAKRMKMN